MANGMIKFIEDKVNGDKIELTRKGSDHALTVNLETGQVTEINEFNGKLLEYDDTRWALHLLEECKSLLHDPIGPGIWRLSIDQHEKLDNTINKFQKIMDELNDRMNKAPKKKITN